MAYVGVPPGRNARMLAELRSQGRDDTVETEGWPETRRRTLSPQALSFETGYLYLQMSSHSNYAARSIYFTRVRID